MADNLADQIIFLYHVELIHKRTNGQGQLFYMQMAFGKFLKYVRLWILKMFENITA